MGGGDPDENHLRTSAMVPPKSNCTLPLLPIRISIAPSLILTQDQKILLCGGYRNFQKCLGLNKDAWQEHSSLNEKRRYAVSFKFYVKSILENQEVVKMLLLSFLGLCILLISTF